MREFIVAGLLITPFVKYALVAALLLFPLHMILVQLRFNRWFWHPPLTEVAIYICILAALNLTLR